MMILIILLQFIIMKFLYWNCKEAGNDRFCSIINDLRKSCKVDVMTITKPSINGVVADKILEKLRFYASFRVKALRDIWRDLLLWNKNKMELNTVKFSRNLVHKN